MNALETLILHAYPWWEMQRVRQMSFITSKPEPLQANTWRHTSLLIDHHYRGVTTPNCDTLYSGAWLDLAHGPVLIEVPATDLPYWSIAAMDLHTDNIAVIGSRYPNSQALLLCSEQYAGELPTDIACVRSKTQVVWLLARYLIGTDELTQTSESLRRAVTLSQWPAKGVARVPASSPLRSTLIPAIRKDAQNFWDIVRATLNEDPALGTPTAGDASLSMAWPAHAQVWTDLDADFQAQFTLAFNNTVATITANNSGNIQTRGQWRYPGADIGNFGGNALYRAEVALWGLGALETKEVLYVSTFTDSNGAMLNGKNCYQFCIPPEGIPAQAFWSLTMYEVDPFGGMYFTANPIKRYAIGDRTEGLQKNADGSITIWMSHAQPSEDKRLANWLPAPQGLFRLMIRAYAPSDAFQSGAVLPPMVTQGTCV